MPCSRATAPQTPHLSGEELAQPLGAAEHERDLLGLRELLGDALLAQAGRKRGPEAADDRLRRACRREYAPPGIGVEAGKAALVYGRHRRERRRACPAGLHNPPDGAGLDLRDRERGAADEEVDMAGDRVVHGRTPAAIGHVDELNAGPFRQQRHGEVTDAAAADRAVADRAGLGLGGGDDVAERLERLLHLSRDHVGRGPDEQHRVEVLLRIVGQVAQHERIRRMVVEHDEPAAAVWARLCDRGGAHASRCAGPVLDDDRRPEPILQARLNQTRDRVGRSAGWVRNDQLEGAGRPTRGVFLRVSLGMGCRARRQQRREHDQVSCERAHADPPRILCGLRCLIVSWRARS